LDASDRAPTVVEHQAFRRAPDPIPRDLERARDVRGELRMLDEELEDVVARDERLALHAGGDRGLIHDGGQPRANGDGKLRGQRGPETSGHRRPWSASASSGTHSRASWSSAAPRPPFRPRRRRPSRCITTWSPPPSTPMASSRFVTARWCARRTSTAGSRVSAPRSKARWRACAGAWRWASRSYALTP